MKIKNYWLRQLKTMTMTLSENVKNIHTRDDYQLYLLTNNHHLITWHP